MSAELEQNRNLPKLKLPRTVLLTLMSFTILTAGCLPITPINNPVKTETPTPSALKPTPEINYHLISKDLLEQAKGLTEDVALRNLMIGEHGANIRTKPSSLNDADIIGYLEPQTYIEQAYLWSGNDPEDAYNPKKSSRWYFIPKWEDRKITGGGFIWSGNFNQNSIHIPFSR